MRAPAIAPLPACRPLADEESERVEVRSAGGRVAARDA
jgi:hypothetical protein